MKDVPHLMIDLTAEAAYLRLSHDPVAKTREVTEAVMVDLNELNVVVGVELLDFDTPVPIERLTKDFHVHSRQLDELRKLGAPAKTFLLSTQSQGTSSLGNSTSGTGTLQSC